MKRFILFGGPCYYASGGFHDFAGSFETLEDAVEFARQQKQVHPDIPRMEDVFEWWHVYDSEQGRCVAASECQGYGAPDQCPLMEN